MNDDLKRKLNQLKQAYEGQLLDKDVYESLVKDTLAATDAPQQETSVDSGAVAQGEGATAVGEGGVNVKGDVQGNIYIGTATTDPAKALRIYREVLVNSSQYLPLRGVDVGASDPGQGEQLRLTQVYIDLDTTEPLHLSKEAQRERGLDKDTALLPAMTAITFDRQVVILGDPGGGKSTFVNYLAYCLAAHTLEPKAGWHKQMKTWPQAELTLLPLVVILRDFAHILPNPLPDKAEASHLWAFIKSRLEAQNLDFCTQPIHDALCEGKVLLLLDGLDEVPTSDQRQFVRDVVLAFMQSHRKNRCLVTCRVLSYQAPATKDDPDLRLPIKQYPSYELAPFSEEKINRFIHAWYHELAQVGTVTAEKVKPMAEELQTAVRRPDLWRLAPNPLLLAVMALVHAHKGRLPDARALLYEDTVEMLLWRWEQVKGRTPLRDLLQQAKRSDKDLKRLLWRLAYEAHTSGDGKQEGLADIAEMNLRRGLMELKSEDWNWADKVLQIMKLRAGLLVERELGTFTFPHRTFQEYLAGAHLATQRNFAKIAVKLTEEGASWREVILLAVGRLEHVSDDLDRPLSLVNRLCPEQVQGTPLAWTQAWLAGDVICEIGVMRVKEDDLGNVLWQRVRHRLAQLVSEGKLTPRERMEAGDTLGKLGDPRPGVCTPEPELVEIPAGTFLMGDEKHKIELDAFAIARYPVTNAQYQMFVDDGGYTEKWRECWTEAGWNWKRNRTNRRDYGVDFNGANQPVVGVTWYEAIAYANWLAKTSGKPYKLPIEAEWERAARHTDGREYPWGNKWQKVAANCKELGLQRTTAVGVFPTGATVEGVLDMSGNAYEWCQTRNRNEKNKNYKMPYDGEDGRENVEGTMLRMLHGGYYGSSPQYLRCSCRRHDRPNYGHQYLGFRVSVAHYP